MKQKHVGLQKVVNVLLVVALLLTFATPAFAEGGPSHDKTSSSPDAPKVIDQELLALMEKYSKLATERSLSAKELADLIAQDKNEKAKWIGIRISRHQTDQYRFGNLSNSELLQPTSLNLCIQPIWQSAGKVIWNFSNPGQYGAKYSVKREYSNNPLVWASPPEQLIDGIYRSYWGSCVAYKVPNTSTTTFYSAEDWTVCYNAFACSVLGQCPKWINPCDNSQPWGGWPDDPLW